MVEQTSYFVLVNAGAITFTTFLVMLIFWKLFSKKLFSKFTNVSTTQQSEYSSIDEEKESLKQRVKEYTRRLFGRAEDFDFEIREIAKKPWHLGTYDLKEKKIVVYRSVLTDKGKVLDVPEKYLLDALLEEVIHKRIDKYTNFTPVTEAFAKAAKAYATGLTLDDIKKELKYYKPKWDKALPEPFGTTVYYGTLKWATDFYKRLKSSKSPKDRLDILKSLRDYSKAKI